MLELTVVAAPNRPPLDPDVGHARSVGHLAESVSQVGTKGTMTSAVCLTAVETQQKRLFAPGMSAQASRQSE